MNLLLCITTYNSKKFLGKLFFYLQQLNPKPTFTLFVSTDYYPFNDEIVIRNVKWGMSKSEIIQCEIDSPILNEDYTLLYNIELFHCRVKLTYYFNNNHLLEEIGIEFPERYNKIGYSSLVKMLRAYLSERYGASLAYSESYWKTARSMIQIGVYKRSNFDWDVCLNYYEIRHFYKDRVK